MPRLHDLTTDMQHQMRTADTMRYLAAAALSGTTAPESACERFLKEWPTAVYADNVRKHLEFVTKAAVLPGGTGAGNWAQPLLPAAMAAGFVEIVRAASVLATLPYQPVPFNVAVPREVTGASFAWVAENAPKPTSQMAFESLKLPIRKTSGIVPLTAELVKLAQPGTDASMRRSLTDGIKQFVDATFLSTSAATAAAPAGILNGVTPVTGTGTIATDLKALSAAYYSAARTPTRSWYILSEESVDAIAGSGNYPGLERETGKFLRGKPVAVSPGAGTNVILVDTDQLFLADGAVTIDVSTHAALQMESAPDAPPTASTVILDLWSHNLVGYRIEQTRNWSIAPTAVSYLVLS